MAFPEVEKIFWFVAFLLEGFIILVCNFLGIVIFIRKHHFKPCLLLVNQCFADFLMGIVALNYCYQLLDNRSFNYKECLRLKDLIKTIALNLPMVASMSSLAAIAAERAYAIFLPFRHRVLQTKHYRYTIIATWCLSCVSTAFLVMSQCGMGKIPHFLSMATITSTGLIILFCYIAVYVKLKFFPVFHNSFNTRRQIRLFRVLFISTTASLITLLPMGLLTLYSRLRCGSYPKKCVAKSVKEGFLFVLYSNNFINFFIYSWQFPDFSKDLKDFFHGILVSVFRHDDRHFTRRVLPKQGQAVVVTKF